MEITAAKIAEIINGKVEGDSSTLVTSFAKIEEAGEGDATFLAYKKFEDLLYTSKAAVIIIAEDLKLKQEIKNVIIRVTDPYGAFVTLLEHYQEQKASGLKGIEQPSFIAASAVTGENIYLGAFSYLGENVSIGKNVRIYPNCFIGANVKIGDNCVLHAGVKIYHDCVIGNNVIIHAGTVIGGDGFGYTPQANGSLRKVPHIGNVVIEDHVEIGCNSCIDRATMGSTLIKKGVKLDNLVQIAHNVVLGYSTVIAGQTGIGGSTRVGNGVMIGGNAAVVEHIQITDGTRIAACAKVTKTVKTPNANLCDSPAFDYRESLKSQAIYRNLPDLEARLKKLESRAAEDANKDDSRH